MQYGLYRRTLEQVHLLAQSLDILQASCRRALFDAAFYIGVKVSTYAKAARPALGLRRTETAQLMNASEKNAMRTGSPYGQAVHSTAEKVQRHVEKINAVGKVLPPKAMP